MSEREGVIKYRLTHDDGVLVSTIDISKINAWRTVLYRLQLIGQLANKYHGLGFGNISQRLYPEHAPFLITATQTGHLSVLERTDFAVVSAACPAENWLHSTGPSRPSSEALTHASVYRLDTQTQAVIHVHSPELWRQTLALRLPHTAADIAYGSVEMSAAVAALFDSGQLRSLPIFSMLGHEDGIVAFGATLDDAAMTLLTQLAKAIAIEQGRKPD